MSCYKFLLSIITLTILATACRNDDEPTAETGSAIVTVGISSGNSGLRWQPLVTSRAETSIPADMPETIGVWAYNDIQALSYSGAGEVFRNRQMYYKQGNSVPDDLDLTPFADNDWPYYDPVPWLLSTESRTVNYKFLSYAPYMPITATPDGTPYVEPIGQAYSNFNGITLHNLPLFTDADIVVSKQMHGYVAKKASEGFNGPQQMTLTHLMARLRLCFKLGDDYSDLRIVRVRKIDVLNYSTSLHNIVVNYSRTPVISNPRSETNGAIGQSELTLYYEPQAGESTATDYLELSKDNRTVFTPFSSVYTLPKSKISSIHIRVLYDVYDTTGQLLRKDETAENDIALPFGLGSTRTIEGGYYYDVNIQVVPTFLYSLSDNDPQYPDPSTDGFLEIEDNL